MKLIILLAAVVAYAGFVACLPMEDELGVALPNMAMNDYNDDDNDNSNDDDDGFDDDSYSAKKKSGSGRKKRRGGKKGGNRRRGNNKRGNNRGYASKTTTTYSNNAANNYLNNGPYPGNNANHYGNNGNYNNHNHGNNNQVTRRRCSAQCTTGEDWQKQQCLQQCCVRICKTNQGCRTKCFSKYHVSTTNAGPYSPTPALPNHAHHGHPFGPQFPHSAAHNHPEVYPNPGPPKTADKHTLFQGFEYRRYKCTLQNYAHGSLKCYRKASHGDDFDCRFNTPNYGYPGNRNGYSDDTDSDYAPQHPEINTCTRGYNSLNCQKEGGQYWCTEYVFTGYYPALASYPAGSHTPGYPVPYSPPAPTYPSYTDAAYGENSYTGYPYDNNNNAQPHGPPSGHPSKPVDAYNNHNSHVNTVYNSHPNGNAYGNAVQQTTTTHTSHASHNNGHHDNSYDNNNNYNYGNTNYGYDANSQYSAPEENTGSYYAESY